MAEVVVKHQKRWIRDVISKQIQNPNVSIVACDNNWRWHRQNERLTGMNGFGDEINQRRSPGGLSPEPQNRRYLSGAIIDVWPVDVMTSLEDTTRMCWPDGDVSGSFVDGGR